jgi:tetratricopeptide (TPR) repeat protein
MKWLIIFLALIGCHFTPQAKYLEDARDQAKAQNWESAVNLYEKLVRVHPDKEEALEASREASRIALINIKDDKRVVFFLKHIVDHTPDHSERVAAQKNMAQIYLEKLNDYPRALVEINRALTFVRAGPERPQLRLMLARAYSFMSEFTQARSEIDQLILENSDPETNFRANFLKANILQNEKKFTEAVLIYKNLLERDPERSSKEQIALSLAVVLEEQESFDEAIAVLEKMRVGYKVPEMIDLKILRLK